MSFISTLPIRKVWWCTLHVYLCGGGRGVVGALEGYNSQHRRCLFGCQPLWPHPMAHTCLLDGGQHDRVLPVLFVWLTGARHRQGDGADAQGAERNHMRPPDGAARPAGEALTAGGHCSIASGIAACFLAPALLPHALTPAYSRCLAAPPLRHRFPSRHTLMLFGDGGRGWARCPLTLPSTDQPHAPCSPCRLLCSSQPPPISSRWRRWGWGRRSTHSAPAAASLGARASAASALSVH